VVVALSIAHQKPELLKPVSGFVFNIVTAISDFIAQRMTENLNDWVASYPKP